MRKQTPFNFNIVRTLDNPTDLHEIREFQQHLVVDGTIASTICASLVADGAINLDMIETNPDFLRTGLATVNFEYFKEFCEKDLGVAELSSTAGSDEGQQLIDKLGFRHTKRHSAVQFLGLRGDHVQWQE